VDSGAIMADSGGMAPFLQESIGQGEVLVLFIVFASLVQSSFLPPKWATVNRNWSRTNPDIGGTEPDHLGPVFCGPWN